jgi:tRNA threonylcarbamoyladenosine dehydratase
LARSGVGRLTLIDLDNVSESNINRQLHALGATVGQAKITAMHQRLQDINPHCRFTLVEDFLTPENLLELLACGEEGQALPAVVDACDQMKTKVALAAWAIEAGALLVSVGAAGGKSQAQAVELGFLSDVTHDPLLAQVRYRLRKHHGAAKAGVIPLACVFSREAVSPPQADCSLGGADNDGSLNCHGYGSVVTVTATFGLVAAGHLLNRLAKKFQELAKSQKMNL